MPEASPRGWALAARAAALLAVVVPCLVAGYLAGAVWASLAAGFHRGRAIDDDL